MKDPYKGWKLADFEENGADLAVVIADTKLPDCPIIYVSDQFLRHSGYDRHEIVGRNCRFMQGERTEQEAIERFRQCLAKGSTEVIKITNYGKSGEAFVNTVLLRPLDEGSDDTRLFLAVQSREKS